MKKTLLILSGLLLAGAVHAEGTADFKWDAEFRLRYTSDNTKKLVKGAAGSNQNDWKQRTKFGFTATKGEKFSTRLGLVHNAKWGDSNNMSGSSSNFDGGTTAPAKGNSVTVWEAYGWWKGADNMDLKFGRAAFTFGDQTIFGANDWGSVPASWEGVWSNTNLDAANLTVFGMKNYDPDTAISGNDDPEIVSYGLVANFKNLPDALKYAGLHLVSTTDDNATVTANSGAAASGTHNSMRYGLTLKGDTSGVDYRFTYDMHSGTVKPFTTGASDVKSSGSMMDLEVGYALAELMNSRVYLNYHSDSGKTDTSSADKSEGYSPARPNMHPVGGLLDVFNWGNLNYIDIGWNLKPNDDLTAGFKYVMFNRTTDKAGVTGAYTIASYDSDKKALGNELDLYVDQKYGDNMTVGLLYGTFTPGEAIKTALPDTHSRIQLQGKMTF